MINCFFDFRFVDPLRRYSRSKSKVVRNCEKFGRFFALPNFRGQDFQKLYPGYNPWLVYVVWVKICDDILISSELIDMYTLNFKVNFKFSRLKHFGVTPVPVGVCASKAWSISSACKYIRAQQPQWAEI